MTNDLRTAMLECAAELTDKWMRQGYLPQIAPHHLAHLGLNDRAARVALNELVAEGRLVTHRDSRGRKTWMLPTSVRDEMRAAWGHR